jgi:hypothetical protein
VSKLEKTLVGVAGEYFVAGELSIRGYLAAVTLRGSRGVDIIASSPDGSRSVSIQVKTNSNGRPQWILTKSSESFIGKSHFYVFVALHGEGQRPDFHIVHSTVVAEYISTNHRKWLAGKRADGGNRRDSAIRLFKDPHGAYKDAWSALKL